MRTLRAASVEPWRDWLAAHHESESEVWLIFYKRETGGVSIAYKDAVDAPTERGSAPRPPRLELPAKLPAYLQTALRKHPAASRTFEALSAEQRRRYFAWIESAKRQETKRRRLEEAIRLLTAGRVLGLK